MTLTLSIKGVPGRLLSEAVRKMPPGQVTIGVDETDIEILGNGPRFTLPLKHAEEL